MLRCHAHQRYFANRKAIAKFSICLFVKWVVGQESNRSGGNTTSSSGWRLHAVFVKTELLTSNHFRLWWGEGGIVGTNKAHIYKGQSLRRHDSDTSGSLKINPKKTKKSYAQSQSRILKINTNSQIFKNNPEYLSLILEIPRIPNPRFLKWNWWAL